MDEEGKKEKKDRHVKHERVNKRGISFSLSLSLRRLLCHHDRARAKETGGLFKRRPSVARN